MIDGTATTFKWYKGSELVETNTSGKFSPMANGIYYCKMANDKFPGLELTTHYITVENEVSLLINLTKGWNAFSLNHIPQDADLQEVLQQLIANNQLAEVVDEDGQILRYNGSASSWVNNIGDVLPTEGYKIKVAANCQLTSAGAPIDLPLQIPLHQGWNIISFPYLSEVDGMKVIQQLIDRNTLVKVMDEYGNAIEDWGSFGGWVNKIGQFSPGKAYMVNVSGNEQLTIFEVYPN